MSPASSAEIAVNECRQVLVWPLALSGPSEGDRRQVTEIVRAEASRLVEANGPWQLVADPLFQLEREIGPPDVMAGAVTDADVRVDAVAGHGRVPAESDASMPREAERQEPYAEFVYFHDFVQRFLYPDADQHAALSASFHLFWRNDIRHVAVRMGSGSSYNLAVESCRLFLFRSGVAILAIEVVLSRPDTTLADVLDLQDVFRRVYNPYFGWSKEERQYQPGLVPQSVAWLRADGSLIGDESRPPSVEAAVERLRHPATREPPVLDHWRELLGLCLRGYELPGYRDELAQWRHILDDRMLLLSCISLKNASLDDILRSDWVRLCFVDGASKDGAYPYTERTLSDFEHEHCYDRFYHLSTRHLFSGYSYVVVGCGGFFDDVIRNHFRHMYFKIALIAQHELATHVAFSSRISRAITDARHKEGGARGPWFRERMLSIQEDFLYFVHEFMFTGISNQLQAQEMYALWRRHLKLDRLHADVKDELASATTFISGRQAQEQADASSRLTAIALIATVLGLAFSFLGMNVLWDGDTINQLLPAISKTGADQEKLGGMVWPRLLGGIAILSLNLTIFAALGLVLARLFRPKNVEARYTPLEDLLRIVFLAGVIIGVGCLVIQHNLLPVGS